VLNAQEDLLGICWRHSFEMPWKPQTRIFVINSTNAIVIILLGVDEYLRCE
jgi:hypothetical protein